MLTVRSTINIASQTVPPIIPVVQGDTGRAILFTLADFTIPAGATATYYVQKPSGEAVYNNATIDGNNVLVELTAQSIIEKGDNYGQVRITVGEEVVTSFDFILLVKEFRGIDAVQSLTEMNIFDKAVEQASEAIDEVKTDALEAIDDAKDEAIEEVTSNFDLKLDASSTKGVQNQVITQAINTVNNAIGDLSGETVTPTATNNYGIGGSVGQVIETWATTDYWHGIYTVTAGNTYCITTVSDFPQQIVVWFTNSSNVILEIHKAFATDHVEMVCTAPTGATKLFVMSYGYDAYHGTVQKVEPLSETVSNLKDDLTLLDNTVYFTEAKNVSLELGTLSLVDGSESASYTRSRTGFLTFDDETQVVAESGAKYAFRFYKADDTWAGAPTIWYTGTNTVKTLASTYTGAVKMRLVCAYSDDRDLQQQTTIDALEHLITTSVVENNIEILDNRITDIATVDIPLMWKIGSIGVNNGQDGISTTRQRTPDYFEYDPNATIKIDTGVKYNIFAYGSQHDFLWSFGNWQTTGGTVESVIDRNNKDASAVKYLRYSVAYSNDATITNVITLGNYFHLSEKWNMQECYEKQERSDRISVSKSGTGNFSIRCAKEQSYTDGTAPVIEWFLLEEPVTGRFYYSKNLKDKIYLFTFPYETYMYSFGVLQNGDIIAVLDADSIETENKSDSNRVNPYVFLASENWTICHEVAFGSSLKPCGWLSNCGLKVLADGSAIFCEYTRQTTYTANVWRLSGDPTNPTNWVVTKSFVVTSTDNSTLFKHCHMVMQDFYTGICYMATGDDNIGSMLWASTDNGQTWTQLVSPDSDGEVNEYGYINGSEKYCRMLTMTFTEDYIYWASDTPTASLHYLFRAERDETTGVLDYSTVSDYVNIPAESGASTYGTAYLPEINAILLLDRCDAYSQSMPVRLIDLTSGTLKTIGTLYVTDNEKATGASLGFRTRFSEWYPFNCFVRVGFGLRGNHYNNDINHNRGFGNTGTWIAGGGIYNINNLSIHIFKDGNNYGMKLHTNY